jgi:hypothetical protein
MALTVAFLALALGPPAQSQEPPLPVESVAEAARNAREHKANSTKQPKIITNDDPGMRSSAPSASASPLEASSGNEVEVPKPQKTGCDNPDAERLKTELQTAQEEQDQIRRELSYNPKVISNGDVDLKNFKPGYSGLNVGGPPLLETQSPIPARVAEVDLEEKLASLNRASRIACDSPEDAEIQTKLDQAEHQLKWLQRKLDLDQATYYSKPNYAEDTAGRARLDAELQQRQDLQAEVERLKSELAASKTK